eukprot:TRINITY_DN8213_c0_g1_i4.p1 TRINITY_DN8213_c0_g1~~TRINITY_DN8213_c0_g1_i4.p1  ORF type:complete len:215 (-),score=44.76 TRINITY_DN8213_c0_g1_i4:84-728(-)
MCIRDREYIKEQLQQPEGDDEEEDGDGEAQEDEGEQRIYSGQGQRQTQGQQQQYQPSKAGNQKQPQKNMVQHRHEQDDGDEQEEEQKGEEAVCEFCGQFNEGFLNQDVYDVHLWRECPMLTMCDLCNQVVKISELNEHLIDECEKRKLNRKCPRCKESVLASEYQDHVEEMACIPAKSLNIANRCPLCHSDIPPGKQGWQVHLLEDGCPNNERN